MATEETDGVAIHYVMALSFMLPIIWKFQFLYTTIVTLVIVMAYMYVFVCFRWSSPRFIRLGFDQSDVLFDGGLIWWMLIGAAYTIVSGHRNERCNRRLYVDQLLYQKTLQLSEAKRVEIDKLVEGRIKVDDGMC